MNLRILVTDDHDLVRLGVRLLLSEAHLADTIDEAVSGAQAIEAIKQKEYDLVLLDMSLPDAPGIEVLKIMKRHAPRLPVMMLKLNHESHFAVRAIKAGAAGALSKEAPAEEMLAAIRRVAAGGRYLSAATSHIICTSLENHAQSLPHEQLSDREYQTMRMLASGKRLTDIGLELSVSVKTVSTYRARLMQKMGMTSNAELTSYALEQQIIAPRRERHDPH